MVRLREEVEAVFFPFADNSLVAAKDHASQEKDLLQFLGLPA
jgi:hypothetical protein